MSSGFAAEADELSDEQRKEILDERARMLSRAQTSALRLDHTLEALELIIGGERFAIEISFVKEVTRLRELSKLPCTPNPILGLMNFRGQILPVLDLTELLELGKYTESPVAKSADRKLLVLQATGSNCGIAVDEVVGIAAMSERDLQSPNLICSPSRASLLRGIRLDMLGLLNVDALLRDPRIQVNDLA